MPAATRKPQRRIAGAVLSLKHLGRWPALAVIAAFLATAGWIYFSPSVQTGHSRSLAKSLDEKDIESAFGMTVDLEPGMLLRLGSLDVVARPEVAFEHPNLLKVLAKDDWLASGRYEDSLEASAGAEADILGYLGLSGSKARIEADRLTKVVTVVEGVGARSLTEADILSAGIKPQFAAQLASDKAVVVVQTVVRARSLSLSYLDKNSKTLTGELPKAGLPATASSTASASSAGTEVYTGAIVGFKQCLWLDPGSLSAGTADKVADDVSKKGYAAVTGGNGMLVRTTRASAPLILNVAREAAAAAAAVHAPPPELAAVRAKEAEAIRRLPPKKVVSGTGTLRQRIPPQR